MFCQSYAGTLTTIR